jgi:8-oxo-dGTP pyrophosphatase MutT (NUDIX family)
MPPDSAGTPDPAAELVAVYDAAGTVIGAAPRGEVYARSLWHGVGGVLLRSGGDPLSPGGAGERVYVHRRTPTKLVMPGLHDCWAGGVVGPGEDPAATAARELAEELGVTGVPLAPLFTLVYDEGEGGLRSHLFAYEARYDGPVHHQPEEVADGWWMPVAQLRARLADPAWPFVPDGRMLAERWFAERWFDEQGS